MRARGSGQPPRVPDRRDRHAIGYVERNTRGVHASRRASTVYVDRRQLARTPLVSARWAAESDFREPHLGDVIQSRGSFGLFYTYLTGSRFGAVDL